MEIVLAILKVNISPFLHLLFPHNSEVIDNCYSTVKTQDTYVNMIAKVDM